MSIDRQKVIDTAQKFAAKGQFDKAIVEYMRVVKEDPTDVRVLLKIGDLQVRKGAKDDAITTYSRVASGYDQQGFFLKAIAVYKQILSIDPNLTELYAKLADLYVKLGLIPDALAHLDALASRYARAGQDDKVVTVLRQMSQIDPSNIACHIKLAELLSKLSRADEAAKEFEAGCGLLKEAGRIDDWAKVGERLLFHKPNDAQLAKDLAQHYLSRQDAKRALPKLQVCFKANPRDVETLELLAAAFRELGQLPKTISVLKEVARLHQEGGQQDKRNETYRRVLELAPNDTEAKEALRGASRLSRRPEAPPASAEHPAASTRKPSKPGMPAASASSAAPPPTAAPAKTGKPVIPMPTAQPAEALDDEEVVEEIVVEDAEEDVYDLKPEKAKPSIKPPAPAVTAQEAPAPVPLARRTTNEPRAAVVAPPPPVARVPAPVPAPAAAPASSAGVDIARLVSEAEIFLKYGLKQKAVAHLIQAAAADPGSVEVHARLRDLFTDQGDAGGAATHSVAIAEILAATDPTAAMAELTHALQMDPNNGAGLELYDRLQGAVPAANYAQPPPPEYPEEYAQADGGQDEGHTAPGARGYDGGGTDAAIQAPPGSARDIEEGLDEAEFFVTQGLFDEARETLGQLLAAHPNHPLVLERFQELEAMAQAQAMPEGDQSFALAEKLAEEVHNVAGPAQFNAGEEMIDVETVFAQFKKGVERTVSTDDADTHYDLGIAYKEMGLTEDAVSEFKIAAQNPKKLCLAETMIGLCFMEKGDVATAIEHFKSALQSPQRNDREEMGLYFELGNAYENVGDLSEAMYFFQKVEKRDPTFRGVKGRVQRLAAHVTSGTRAQPQSTDLDEVDRAFDELLKG